MQGLDLIMKRALGTRPEGLLESHPKDLASASKNIIKYIESNLPKVIEVDFIPLCFDITKEETQIIMGGKHGSVSSFDLFTQKTLKDIELCSCSILSINFALQDSLIIVTNSVFSFYLLKFSNFEILQCTPLGPNSLDVRLGLNKESVFVTNSSENVSFYDLTLINEKPRLQPRLIRLEDSVNCIDVSDDGSLVAFGLKNGIIKLFHGESESELQSTDNLNGTINKICFSQHRKMIAVVLNNNFITVLGIGAVFTLKHTNNYHKGTVTSMSFVRDDRYLVTGGTDSIIIMHDMKVERSPYYLELFDYSILWFKPSNNHKKLFYTQNTNKFMIWEPPLLSKNAKYRKHSDQVNFVVFVPNNFELLSLGNDGLAIF